MTENLTQKLHAQGFDFYPLRSGSDFLVAQDRTFVDRSPDPSHTTNPGTVPPPPHSTTPSVPSTHGTSGDDAPTLEHDRKTEVTPESQESSYPEGASLPIREAHVIGGENRMAPGSPVGSLTKEIYVLGQAADKHAPNSMIGLRLGAALQVRREAMDVLAKHNDDANTAITSLRQDETAAIGNGDSQTASAIRARIKVIKHAATLRDDSDSIVRKLERRKGGEYFDPPAVLPPAEVLGLPAQPLAQLGRAVGELALIAPTKTPRPLHRHAADLAQNSSQFIRLFPLIERIQSGEKVTPLDVRDYRRAIKKSTLQVSSVDFLTVALSGLLIGIPARRALNRKIEAAFPEKVSPALDKASVYLPQLEEEFDFIAQFDNPREQFVSEVAWVSQAIRNYAWQQAKARGSAEVTAEDAASGIRHTLETLANNEDAAKQHVPMLAHFAGEQLQKGTTTSSDALGVAAPEIMSALEAALPTDQQDDGFMENIAKYPHPKRGLANWFAGSKLTAVQQGGSLLLTSIRDLLPTHGSDAKDIFSKIETFLKANQPEAK